MCRVRWKNLESRGILESRDFYFSVLDIKIKVLQNKTVKMLFHHLAKLSSILSTKLVNSVQQRLKVYQFLLLISGLLTLWNSLYRRSCAADRWTVPVCSTSRRHSRWWRSLDLRAPFPVRFAFYSWSLSFPSPTTHFGCCSWSPVATMTLKYEMSSCG